MIPKYYTKRKKKENEKFKELIDEISIGYVTEVLYSNTLKSLQYSEFNASKQLINLIKTGKCFFNYAEFKKNLIVLILDNIKKESKRFNIY